MDKAPTVLGTLDMTALPTNGQSAGQIDAACPLNPGQTTCNAAGFVALNAPVGGWTISRIQFSPQSGGPAIQLSKHGDLSFRVEPHGDLDLPSSATVSEIN